MITLYQPPAVWGLLNASPFCMKLEVYLKIAEIEYQVKPFNPQKAPAGKMPYIKKPNGESMGDSSRIIDYLKSEIKDLDEGLSAEEKALSLAFQRMLEEHFYFAAIYYRWLKDENFVHVKKAFFDSFPWPIKEIVPPIILKKLRRDLKGQGLGRLDEDYLAIRANQDLQAVADFLGDKTYCFGETPRTLDAVFYAFLATAYIPDMPNPMKLFIEKNQILKDYILRMEALYGLSA